jgi:predicted MPP superfamily phosphohydrolase
VHGYVSRGLGVSSLPVRIDCPAELTVLDLAPIT